MRVPNWVTTKVFSKVFGSSKKEARSVAPTVGMAVQAISRFGTERVKEFFLALPIFVLFVRELLRQRHELEAQKQIVIIGAAASVSTLGIVVLVGVLGSLPVQLLLLVSHPYLGVPLLVTQGLTIALIVTVLVWLVVYVLNFVLEGDATYQRIRAQIIPPNAQQMLAELQSEIERSGADLRSLRKVVQKELIERGSKADARKVEKTLARLEKRIHRRLSDQFEKVVK